MVLNLTLRDVQNPLRRDVFDFSELDGERLPREHTLICITTENDGQYELFVVGVDEQGPLVVVRTNSNPVLRVPRVASYWQEVRGKFSPRACVRAGTSMAFRYFMPDQSSVGHSSGLICPQGIAIVSPGDVEPFHAALRIFQGTMVASTDLHPVREPTHWPCLMNSGLSPEELHSLWQNIQTFHPGAQAVLREVFEGAGCGGVLPEAISRFQVLFRTMWAYQEEGQRGGIEGSPADVSAFNKLRELAGVPWAVSVRDSLR